MSEMKPVVALGTQFTDAFVLHAESGRLGLVSCLECGAALVVGDASFDALDRHRYWHWRGDSLSTGESAEARKALEELVAKAETRLAKSWEPGHSLTACDLKDLLSRCSRMEESEAKAVGCASCDGTGRDWKAGYHCERCDGTGGTP